MKHLLTLMLILFSFSFNGFSQIEPIDVAELTLKIRGMKTKEVFYGFAEGDKVMFNFEELHGRSLNKLEIIEYPSSTKFSDYKTNLIKNKELIINKTGIYKFIFDNSSLSKRICKIKIERTPANAESKRFNTSVIWKTRIDTTWKEYTKDVIVRYENYNVTKSRKILSSIDTLPVELIDRVETVHTLLNANGDRSIIFVKLPEPTGNQLFDYRTTETISWAYWIGVGNEGAEAYEKSKQQLLKSATAVAASINPVAGLALGVLSFLSTTTVGDNVKYWFIPDYANASAFKSKNSFYQMGDNGDVVTAYGRNDDFLMGSFYIGLDNDHAKAIKVKVTVMAITVVKTYKDETYQVQKSRPIKESQTFRDPIINKVNVPVNAQ